MLHSILNIVIIIFIIIILSFILTQIINGFQFFKKCPYCKRRFTAKTPDYYSCNYFVFSKSNKFPKTNVCYKCFYYNDEVKHLR